jgi:His/Glu/Gln/Arg/opine family amino acid ABC transporter permease subunit
VATRSIRSTGGKERIPFYRNVKVVGILAQLIFLALVVVGFLVLYNNVTTALERANIPANFNFLRARAGIPIGESPIRYNTSDTYARALWVGVLNTLKVSLVGVVFATLLGILVGVARLSSNWLLRQIALIYVETIRNTPLAVQLVFWFFAVLVPLPPRISGPIELPGGAYFSQVGLALPWLYPSYSFSAWVPWLVGAAALFALLVWVRRLQIRRSERPGNPWFVPLAAALVLAAVGYVVTERTSELPATTTNYLPDRGRGTVFVEGEAGSSRFLPHAAVRVTIPEGQLRDTTQSFNESRRRVYSSFRFPALRDHEVGAAEVTFADPESEAASRLSIHYLNFPSSGLLYEDRNGNGEYDPGEEVSEAGTGFNGVPLVLRVENFERRVVADRNGQFRMPQFEPVGAGGVEEGEAEEAPPPAASASPAALFGAPRTPTPSGDEAAEAGGLEATVEVLPTGPLVLSVPTIPRSDYEGGVRLTAAFMALLLGLVIYTASFIAEIVRGGIQAVPKGQREAAKSLGLSDAQTFNLVVFPQALRVILPPLISQYLNLTKNSSLALLITYPDFFAVGRIVANQTGATVPIILIIIAGYLTISLIFAFILNIVNERFALVER